jgi:hypothetical protein
MLQPQATGETEDYYTSSVAKPTKENERGKKIEKKGNGKERK